MTILKFKKVIEPLFFLKKCIILIDDCKYGEVYFTKDISFPSGTYLIKIRILPNTYSNTSLITDNDTGKTISIEGFFGRHRYLFVLLYLWLLVFSIWIFFNSEILTILVTTPSVFLLGYFFYFTKFPEKLLKIRIS